MTAPRDAIEVRCAGQGRKCRRQLTVCCTIPGEAALAVRSGSGAVGPPWTDRLPLDFANWKLRLVCPVHPIGPGGTPSTRSLEEMPGDLLADAYRRFLATGKLQTVWWAYRA